MRLKCIRTNCFTGKETEEIHTASVKIGTGYVAWVYLSPGVTGYESCSVESLLKSKRGTWPACAGTPERWDTLVVPEEEVERLADHLRLIAPILQTIGCISQKMEALS